MLQYLRPSASEKLSRLRLLQHLKPVFSQEESNSLKFEKECYVAFGRYCSECAAGRRVVTLENILELYKMCKFGTNMWVLHQPVDSVY